LLAHVLNKSEEALLRDPRAPVPADQAQQFAALLARRIAHEPFAYLTGRVGFWTLDLEVSPATLIPRADSETLVEAALEACTDKRAPLSLLDLGTGTGALMLAVLSELPAASGVGVDLKPEAAALAARNAARLGLSGRARFLAGDWAAALAGRFDLILCNPPYIESAVIPALMPEVARHEPASALDGGADGLDAYRRIIADLPRLLAPRGVAVLELGQGQQAAVEALGRAAGLTPEACRADLGGVPRALVLRAA
jgi:release factor glutamine methyltransferase